MMRAAGTWRKWIPIVVMVSWIYVGSNLLQNSASVAVNYILLGGIIGVTEVLIGLSIAMEQVFPFAAGLIFLGTLLSSIPLFHAGSVSFPPDHWKIAVALAGSTALLFSPRIRQMIRHISMFHGLEFLDGKPESKLGPASREDVQITIRLDRDFDFLRRPRCAVTVRHPRKSTCSAAQTFKSDSDRNERHPTEQDHKLPLWVR